MMSYSGRVLDYLGGGLAAERPATLNLHPGAIGLWRSSDTGELSVWSDAAWWAVGGYAGGAPEPAVVVKSGNYVVAATDAGSVLQMDVATANTLTIQPDSTASLPVGSVLEVWQKGAGQTTIVAGAGVSILVHSTLTLKLKGQNSGCSLRKVAANTWRLVGDMETA